MMQNVFILGAGASIPFGYPSGKELIELIILSLHPSYRYSFNVKQRAENTGHKASYAKTQAFFDYELYMKCGFSAKQIYDFKVSLSNSNKSSIDAFLLERNEFIEIGKIAIANVLLKFERPTELTYLDDNWLYYLWNKFNLKLSDFENSNLVFITYNYDRLIEQYFYLSLKYAFGLSDDKIKDVLDRIPIIHLHGQLGYLPWQNETDSIEYNFEFEDIEKHINNVIIAAKNIKIIYDTLDKNVFEIAKEIIHASDNVYMLGLGFHPLNIRRLEVSYKRKSYIRCTAFGLTGFEINQIQSKYKDLKLDENGFDNLQFLRNNFSF